ncbi:hypothetical protein D3C85_1670350 [compost metagenome]
MLRQQSLVGTDVLVGGFHHRVGQHLPGQLLVAVVFRTGHFLAVLQQHHGELHGRLLVREDHGELHFTLERQVLTVLLQGPEGVADLVGRK